MHLSWNFVQSFASAYCGQLFFSSKCKLNCSYKPLPLEPPTLTFTPICTLALVFEGEFTSSLLNMVGNPKDVV
jgi:hypothetical protein